MDADRLPLNFRRANCLILVDTGVECVWIFSGHPPEWILDDDWGVVANAQFPQREYSAPHDGAEIHCIALPHGAILRPLQR